MEIDTTELEHAIVGLLRRNPDMRNQKVPGLDMTLHELVLEIRSESEAAKEAVQKAVNAAIDTWK